MRILIALNSYEEDGPGLLLYRLCQRWVPEPDMCIGTVALSRDGALVDRFHALGVSTEVVSSRGLGGIERLRDWARRLRKRSDCPDLIHSHLLWPDLALRFVHKELDEIPLISTCHGLHAVDEKGRAKGTVYRVLDKLTRQRCRAWVAVSEFVSREMIRAGYPQERVHLIPNGVDCVQTYPILPFHQEIIRQYLNVELDAPIIGAVGTLRPLKGHDAFIRAMPKILETHPRCVAFIFGAGSSRDDLIGLARRLGVLDQMRFIGPLSTMLPQVLSTLDVVVHPSRVEAYGLVVAESQACCTPVVASRIGGIPEIVCDGQTGYLFEKDNIEQLAQHVIALLNNPEERNEMGENGRDFISDEFELGLTANAYVNLWCRVLGIPEMRPVHSMHRAAQPAGC